jgi:Nif-specific regulatory protein
MPTDPALDMTFKKIPSLTGGLYSMMAMAKELLAELDVQSVLSIAMDRLIEISRAERGMIILFDKGDGILFQIARNYNKKSIDQPEFEVSRTLIDKVRSDGKPICLRNAFDGRSLKKSESITRLKILSVICLPLSFKKETIGAVYLDNRTVRGIFEEETCAFVSEFAEFISLAVYRSLEHFKIQKQLHVLEEELREKFKFDSIVGSHPKIVALLKMVTQVADTDATVLVQGESGTGKELIAQAIHFNSSRRDNPFIPINCAALPENLLESELFGHVRGAFTGAVKDKAGWFERANGGTLFLDEIGEMSAALQVKLLRVLQTGDYSRVGSTEIKHCEVRIVAAASQNLQKIISEGRFREELYYRLNVIDLFIPPLRERKCDIPILIRHFLDKYGKLYNKMSLRLSKEAETTLLLHDFPGNIRELENIIQRAVVLAEGEVINSSCFPANVIQKGGPASDPDRNSSFKDAKRRAVDAFEREYLAECLRSAGGNISRAAKCAGMDVKNFHVKIRKYRINPTSFKQGEASSTVFN